MCSVLKEVKPIWGGNHYFFNALLYFWTSYYLGAPYAIFVMWKLLMLKNTNCIFINNVANFHCSHIVFVLAKNRLVWSIVTTQHAKVKHAILFVHTCIFLIITTKCWYTDYTVFTSKVSVCSSPFNVANGRRKFSRMHSSVRWIKLWYQLT